MKKMIALFAAALVALLPAAAAVENVPADAQTETKTYSLDHFDALEVSWIYRVDLRQSATWKVEVEAPDFVMPYLQVKVRGDRLVLGVSGLPGDVRRRLERGSYRVHASVAMPALTKVEMSGASHLESEGSFESHEFAMELSGATSLRGLELSADYARIECSGASKFQLAGTLTEARITLSGAAKGNWTGDCSTLLLNQSGSAKLELTGICNEARVELSAASHLLMKGSLGALLLTGSGAAKAELLDCPVNEARINLSGASSARMTVLDKFGVTLSGAARCQYKAGDRLQMVETDVDRGASLKLL